MAPMKATGPNQAAMYMHDDDARGAGMQHQNAQAGVGEAWVAACGCAHSLYRDANAPGRIGSGCHQSKATQHAARETAARRGLASLA